MNKEQRPPDLPFELERVLITREQIATRIVELGAEIDRDHADQEELHLVGVLKGAFILMADLARQIQTPHTVDFMALSSYGKGAVSSGAVRILMDLRDPIAGKHIILVEDIIDSGQTLFYLQETLRSRHPASLKTCVLLEKTRSQLDVKIDYLGFTIPDVWVVGYGLDLGERFRTLPYIAEIKP